MIDREDMNAYKQTDFKFTTWILSITIGFLIAVLVIGILYSCIGKPEDTQQASSTSQSSSSEEIEYIEVSGKIDSIGGGGGYGCWVSVNNRKFYSNEFKDADFCTLTSKANIKLYVRKEYQFKQ